jgi:P-type E1-E2 ATPase
LATPIALKIALGKALREGILVKTAEAIETGAAIDTLVLDKTGTLTVGSPQMAAVAGRLTPEVKQLVFSAARKAQHPLSRSIAEYVQTPEMQPIEPESWKEVAGQGWEAVVDGNRVRAGRKAWAEQSGAELQWPALSDAGFSLVYLSVNEEAVAVFALEDPLKPEAAETVRELKQKGLQIVLLTGDRPEAALPLARKLGIEEVKAGQTPIEKAETVDRLQQQGRQVAMVGDGMNDAVAMARARLSVAMGNGADLAIAGAQVALLRGNLKLLPALIRLSRRTVGIARQNLFWAFAYNVVTIPVAMGLVPFWHISPMWAGGAMAASSLTVVLNSLRVNNR